MKKILILLAITSLFACKTPQNSVDGFTYDGKKVCVNGSVVIYAPTVQQLDSTLQAITKGLVSFQHVSDSADTHTYKYILCSPPLNNK